MSIYIGTPKPIHPDATRRAPFPVPTPDRISEEPKPPAADPHRALLTRRSTSARGRGSHRGSVQEVRPGDGSLLRGLRVHRLSRAAHGGRRDGPHPARGGERRKPGGIPRRHAVVGQALDRAQVPGGTRGEEEAGSGARGEAGSGARGEARAKGAKAPAEPRRSRGPRGPEPRRSRRSRGPRGPEPKPGQERRGPGAIRREVVVVRVVVFVVGVGVGVGVEEAKKTTEASAAEVEERELVAGKRREEAQAEAPEASQASTPVEVEVEVEVEDS